MLNKAILMGRLTADPELKHTPENTPVTSFTLAVNRTFGQDQQADFIDIVAWRNTAELVCKWFCKGMQMAVCGRIQTGSYTNRDGVKVYTTEVVVEEQEFAESKNASSANTQSYQAAPAPAPSADAGDGFMNIPDGIDEELPFN